MPLLDDELLDELLLDDDELLISNEPLTWWVRRRSCRGRDLSWLGSGSSFK